MEDRANCGGCTYCQEAPIDPNNLSAERVLMCRRYPPVPVAIHTPKGVMIQTLYPTVTKTNWCGDYKEAHA